MSKLRAPKEISPGDREHLRRVREGLSKFAAADAARRLGISLGPGYELAPDAKITWPTLPAEIVLVFFGRTRVESTAKIPAEAWRDRTLFELRATAAVPCPCGEHFNAVPVLLFRCGSDHAGRPVYWDLQALEGAPH